MVTLVVVGFLAGVITSLSPCVLPVLPVLLTSGGPQRRKWRPYLVIAGLVLSFALSTLFGSLVLTALRLPQTLLRDTGIAVLALIGVGLIWQRFGDLLERPFARLSGRPAPRTPPPPPPASRAIPAARRCRTAARPPSSPASPTGSTPRRSPWPGCAARSC